MRLVAKPLIYDSKRLQLWRKRTFLFLEIPRLRWLWIRKITHHLDKICTVIAMELEGCFRVSARTLLLETEVMPQRKRRSIDRLACKRAVYTLTWCKRGLRVATGRAATQPSIVRRVIIGKSFSSIIVYVSTASRV